MAAHGWLHQVLHTDTVRETRRWDLEAQRLQVRNGEASRLLQACEQGSRGDFWCEGITNHLWTIQETHGGLKPKEVSTDLCWSVGLFLVCLVAAPIPQVSSL